MSCTRSLVRGATFLAVLLTAALIVPVAHAAGTGTTPAATPAAPAPAPTPAAGTPAPTGTPAAGTPAAPPPGGAVASTADPNAPAPPAPAGIRLRRLEQRVQALKEQAWRVKARVGMLKEAVLGGGIGARGSIIHENKMGGSFQLVKLVYGLDGTQIFAKSDDTGALNDARHQDILSGPIAPGNHTISVLMVYRGNGYGVFAYLKDYKFTVRSSHTFTASEGKLTQITVVGYEKGGVTTPLEKRPAVDFKVNVVSDRGAAPATPAPDGQEKK